jgi:hypothetical protein
VGQTPYPRLLTIAALVVSTSAGALAVRRAIADRRSLVTGEAKWIWATREIPRPEPRRFTAERRFALVAPPAVARASVFVDRSYVLLVNVERVGEGEKRSGDALDAYDIARFLRVGENLIAIKAASPTGVGGILFCLDFGSAGPGPIVSDGRWTVDGLPTVVWGRPPMYPWGYPPTPSESPRLKVQSPKKPGT